MAVEWITPKTNWTDKTFINLVDVNRIVNNMTFLRRFIYSISRPDFKTMPNPQNNTEYPYADELNAIEDNLEALNLKYILPIGNKQVFEENKAGWNYAELNRIETAQLQLYNRIKIGRESINMMKFTFGTQRGFRR